MRKIFFKQKYLDYILSGEKDLEGRIGYDNIRSLRIGDPISLNGEHTAKIIDITQYPSFNEAVTADNYRRLIPDAKTPEDAIKTYHTIYPPWKQKKYGVYILELKL